MWGSIGIVGVAGVSALTAQGVALPIVGAAAAVAVYWLVMRFVAHRDAPEIRRAHAGRLALLGGAIGFGFIAVSMLAVITEFTFTGSSGNVFRIIAGIVAVSIGAAVTEELIFRGLALQALERLCGSWAALAITALLFGGLHLANPGARCGVRSRSPSRRVSYSAPRSCGSAASGWSSVCTSLGTPLSG